MTRKKPLKILLIFKPELMPKYEDIITCYNERHNYQRKRQIISMIHMKKNLNQEMYFSCNMLCMNNDLFSY